MSLIRMFAGSGLFTHSYVSRRKLAFQIFDEVLKIAVGVDRKLEFIQVRTCDARQAAWKSQAGM
jgi:hypothetical protein